MSRRSAPESTPTPMLGLEYLEERLKSLLRLQPDYPLVHAEVARLAVLVEKRMADICGAALKPFGITYVMYQSLVLAYAACDRPLTPTELAHATGERATNITHICDDRERRGLIRRAPDANDRRRVVLTLTPDGEALLHAAQKPVWALWAQRYAGVDAQALSQLRSLLRQQWSNLADAAEPRP